MKFRELKDGDVVYTLSVKNSEIVDSEIKTKLITEVYHYKDTDSAEIHFSDDTMIIPGRDDEYVIRGLGTISNIIEPFNFVIYATSYECCYKAISKIVSSKITQLGEDYKKVNIQMARLCLMSSIVRELGVKACVVLDPVYAD